MGIFLGLVVFISFKTRKENTAIAVPWLLGDILATGALLGNEGEQMLRVVLAGICRAALCSFIAHLCTPRSGGGTELIPAKGAPASPGQ